VAYAENFDGGGYIQWNMVVICIWCTLFVTSRLTSYSCFQTNVFAKLVDTRYMFFYTHFPLIYVSLHWI